MSFRPSIPFPLPINRFKNVPIQEDNFDTHLNRFLSQRQIELYGLQCTLTRQSFGQRSLCLLFSSAL